jgi:hypothetical protein
MCFSDTMHPNNMNTMNTMAPNAMNDMQKNPLYVGSSNGVTPADWNPAAAWNPGSMRISSQAQTDSLLKHMAASFMTAGRRNSLGMGMGMIIPEFPIVPHAQALDSITRDLFDQEDLYEPVPLHPANATTTTTANPNFYLQQQQRQDVNVLERLLNTALVQVMGDTEPIEDLSFIFDHQPSHPLPIKKRTLAANAATAVAMDSNPAPQKRQRLQRRQEEDADTTPRFRPYQEKQWVEQFDELLKFKLKGGHCLVPHTFDENPTLSRWVKRQRYQYKLKKESKTSTMTNARILQLEDIGFVWDSHAAAWQERRNELAFYQTEHGDCNVPSNYLRNPQLATWVKCQRRQCKIFWNGKTSNMTLDRFTSLNQLGFTWELRSGSGANISTTLSTTTTATTTSNSQKTSAPTMSLGF